VPKFILLLNPRLPIYPFSFSSENVRKFDRSPIIIALTENKLIPKYKNIKRV
jgi:hypothetical protein